MTASELIKNNFYKFTSSLTGVTYLFQFDSIKNKYVFSTVGVVDNSNDTFKYYTHTCLTGINDTFTPLTDIEILFYKQICNQ